MRRTHPLAIVLALSVGLPLAAGAQPRTCDTPREAIDGLLYWQQPEHDDPQAAARCVDPSFLPEGLDPVSAARRLKAVLDARGLFVDVDALPRERDHQDPSGRARYQPFPTRLPELSVERVGERWVFSGDTLHALPALYADTFTFDLGSLERHLPTWARGEVMGVAIWKLLGLLVLFLLGAFARTLVMFVVASQARRFMTRAGARWGAELLSRVDAPVGLLAGAGVVALFLPGLHLPVRLASVALLAVRVTAAVSLVWGAYRLVDVLTGWLQARADRTATRLDDQLVPLVRTSLKVFTLALGIVFVLQNLDVDVASLLAGLGLGGLAFALAARDTVANFFGAVTIFLDRPFQIGDWVAMADVEGIVERVGFRSTRVRTFYNSLVAVPNAKVADTVVDNYGERAWRRTSFTLGVTYDTTPEQMQALVEGIRAILQANPHTRKDYYEVHFAGFGASSLDVLVYFFFKADSWSQELQERHNVLLEILRLAHDLDVGFAFPTRTLHLATRARETEVPEVEPPADLRAVVDAYGPGGTRARPAGPRISGGWLAGTAAPGSSAPDPSERDGQ